MLQYNMNAHNRLSRKSIAIEIVYLGRRMSVRERADQARVSEILNGWCLRLFIGRFSGRRACVQCLTSERSMRYTYDRRLGEAAGEVGIGVIAPGQVS